MRDAFGRIQKAVVVGGSSDIGAAIIRAVAPDETALVGRASRRLSDRAAEFGATTHLHGSGTDGLEVAISGALQGSDTDLTIIAMGTPSAATLHETFEVNTVAAIMATAQIAEHLATQSHGQLVVLSSIAAVRPRPSNYAYGAGKAALDFYARGLMDEIRSRGVAMLVVRPGFVRTSMTKDMKEAPFAVDAAAVGSAVARAVAEGRSGVIYVPPILRWVALAMSVMPGALLEALDRRARS